MASPHIHIPFQNISEHIDFIRERRVNLEIYFGSGALDAISEDDVALLKDNLDYGPSLSFHAPFMDLSPGAVDARVREVTLERFSQVLRIAEVLRPGAVVFHSGYEKWKYALNVDLWIEKSLLTWEGVCREAARLGVKVAIENIFEDEPSNLKLLMEQMNTGNFGICFDTGHFNLFSRVPLGEWMDALNPYILELHLHDNDRSSDQHRPMGEGTFDFAEFFRLLRNKDCIYTLEAHSREDAMKSMAYLEKIVF